MKIVNIAGGLGNQMFQYAFAVMLQDHFPDEQIFIDTQHYHSLFFKRFGSVNLHNGYEIDKLFKKATLPIASSRELRRVTRYIPNYVLSRIARKLLPVKKTEHVAPYSESYCVSPNIYTDGDRYYEGYWQSALYYQDIRKQLLNIYSHPIPNEYNSEMISQIESTDSVGIHIRRGDYLNAPEFVGICDLPYYQKAIKQVKSDKKPHYFYIFSNDIDWCKDNITPLLDGNEVIFVTGNTGKQSCWDMFLMTYCKDLIIANSSFSWWGAFLNKRSPRVFAPDPWINRDCRKDVYAEGWIRIK